MPHRTPPPAHRGLSERGATGFNQLIPAILTSVVRTRELQLQNLHGVQV